jgi:hypothetical protein
VRFGESTREYVEPAAAVALESHAAQVRADEGGIAQARLDSSAAAHVA